MIDLLSLFNLFLLFHLLFEMPPLVKFTSYTNILLNLLSFRVCLHNKMWLLAFVLKKRTVFCQVVSQFQSSPLVPSGTLIRAELHPHAFDFSQRE